MSQHIFQLESELQNSPEAAPKASPSFSVSERNARYGSSALLEGSASQSLERTKVTNQGESDGLFANKQSKMFHARWNYGNSFHGVRLRLLLPL